jgi:sulfite exporter TauE/SafE
MLASITPLGERSRNSRWATTITAFTAGSILAGAAWGTAAGLIGAPLSRWVPGSVRVWSLVGLVAAGLVFDLGIIGRRLPGPRRQVNEQWLQRYRGWVYGLGFGAQLGAGLVTIVSTSAVYSTVAAAVLTGSPGWGAAVGITFGLVRALALVPASRIKRPADLVVLDALLRRWDRPARVASTGVLLGLIVVAAAWAVL